MNQTPHGDDTVPPGDTSPVDGGRSDLRGDEQQPGVTPADVDDSLASRVDELTHTGDARTDDPR